MTCPKCNSDNPDVAAYCNRCGQGLRKKGRSAQGRDDAYAVQSAESVTQFALISTIMPHTSRRAADNYRWGLVITVLIVLVFNLMGMVPAAIVAAAFLVPIVYLIYLYDVNVWEETPAPVIALLFIFTGILATIASLVFFQWVFRAQFGTLAATSGDRGGIGALSLGALLVFAVLLPIVAEIVKNIGPILLMRRPAFDDMIDGFTFGVASGTAYAAFETVVAFGPAFTVPDFQVTQGLSGWIVVILNLMIVKSVIYGSATGIAAAAFSGRGEGVDGLTPSYYANFAFAVGANVLYWLGIRLLAYAPFGQALGLIWGIVVAGALILRVRTMLQAALLDAAVEDAVANRRNKKATTDSGWCPECESQLLADSMFCIVCGNSVRATSARGRRHIREATTGGARA